MKKRQSDPNSTVLEFLRGFVFYVEYLFGLAILLPIAGQVNAQDRFELPQKEDLELVRPIVHEAIGAIADSYPESSGDFAKNVLELASTETDSIKKYALLQELLDRSIVLKQTDVAFKVADSIAASFHYSASSAKIGILKQLIPTKKNPIERAFLLGLLISNVREAIKEDNTQIAKDACAFALRSMPKDNKKEMSAYFAKLKKEAEDVEAFQRIYLEARARLVDFPNDKDAVALAAKFEFYKSGDVEKAMKDFELSGNKLLLEIAAMEAIDNHPEPKDMKHLGDLWWELSLEHPPALRKRFQERAASWYLRCEHFLQGVDKVIAQKRVEDSRAEERFAFVTHDLLAASVRREIHHGNYDASRKTITLTHADASYCQFFLELPDEYDLEYRFKRTSGQYGFFFNFPSKGKPFTWSNSGHANGTGSFHGFAITQKNNKVSSRFTVEDGVSHILKFKVRLEKLQCIYDDRIVSEVNDPFDPKNTNSDVIYHHTWAEPHLAIGDWWGTLEIQSAMLIGYR
ncbi:hypothetical protein SH467x_001374 [Pirellulaceae bacterium SH467]